MGVNKSEYTRVEQALKGLLSPDALGGSDQADYFDKLSEMYWSPSPSPTAEAFFADRRERGVGVGMDDAGRIVHRVA